MKEISILDIIKYYLRNLGIVLSITLITLIIGYYYVERCFTPTYRESTTIILGKSNNTEDDEISSSTLSLYDGLINNYLKLLKSQKLLSNIKEDLNLELSISELSNKINYSVSDSSQLIEISVTDKDDELAVSICNQIIAELKQQVYEIYGLNNIIIVDKAQASNNKVYSESFVIIAFTLLGFMSSSFIVIMNCIFNNQITFQNSNQIIGINNLGKTTHFQSEKDIEINLSEVLKNDFRMIRSNLLDKLKPCQTIMVTNLNKNNSKSYTTYHLAKSLTKINKKVLIIDMNQKDGLLSKNFLEGKEGIIEVLNKQKTLTEVTKKINDIDMISLGNKEKIDLISSAELNIILEKLKQKYEFILIETPSYKNNFESISIFNLVDGVIIITNQKKIKLKDIQLIEEIKKHQILGILFIKENRKKLYYNNIIRKFKSLFKKTSSKTKQKAKTISPSKKTQTNKSPDLKTPTKSTKVSSQSKKKQSTKTTSKPKEKKTTTTKKSNPKTHKKTSQTNLSNTKLKEVEE